MAGDPSASVAHFEACAEASELAADLRNVCRARANVGFVTMELGAYAEAEAHLRAALAAAERMGLQNMVAVSKHNLGMTLAHQGRLEEGRAIEEEALVALATQGERRLEAGTRSYLAIILRQLGDLSGAEREARAAIEVVAAIKPGRANALAVLADVLLRAGRSVEALAAATEARAILEELGTLEEGEALVRLVHGEALAATGAPEEAARALQQGRAWLLDKAEKLSQPRWRESFLSCVHDHVRLLGKLGNVALVPPKPAGYAPR